MSFEIQVTDYAQVEGDLSGEFVRDIVTLDEAKKYIKQDYASGTDADEDTLIAGMITGAREWIERYIDQSIIKKQIVAFTSDQFSYFDLPLPPVTSITEVLKIDLEGTETAMVLNTDYYSTGMNQKRLIFYKTWATEGNEIVGIKVTYLAYMTSVPKILKDQALALISEMYYNRGDSTQEAVNTVPFKIQNALRPFRKLTL